MPGQPIAGPNPYTSGYQTQQYARNLPPMGGEYLVNPNWSSATTATAAGTTTLTSVSKPVQIFTGSTTQTVALPTTSVVGGAAFLVINQSTGAVTVQSSGANTVLVVGAGTSASFVALVATPTTAANWQSQAYATITPNTTIGLVGSTTGTNFDSLAFPPSGGVAAAAFSVYQENLNPPIGAGGNLGPNTSIAEATGQV
jgi:hypothetical protein